MLIIILFLQDGRYNIIDIFFTTCFFNIHFHSFLGHDKVSINQKSFVIFPFVYSELHENNKRFFLYYKQYTNNTYHHPADKLNIYFKQKVHLTTWQNSLPDIGQSQYLQALPKYI